METYISLVLKILIGFGLAFQLPVIVVLLAMIGLISAEQLVKHRRIALIAITIISALIAPPDAISMLLLMVPLYLLYEGAIIVVKILRKNTSSSEIVNTNQS